MDNNPPQIVFCSYCVMNQVLHKTVRLDMAVTWTDRWSKYPLPLCWYHVERGDVL